MWDAETSEIGVHADNASGADDLSRAVLVESFGRSGKSGNEISPHSEFTISETKALVFSGKCPVYQDPEWRGKLLSPREDVHSLNTLQAVGH